MLFHGIELFVFCGFHKCFLCSLQFHPSGPANTCSLVISHIFLTAENSHMISIIMSSLFMQLINCLFSLLSFSLYLHSFTFILRLPIHSSSFPLCSVISMQHYRYIIISLRCSYNFSLSASTSSMLDLHFSFFHHLMFA